MKKKIWLAVLAVALVIIIFSVFSANAYYQRLAVQAKRPELTTQVGFAGANTLPEGLIASTDTFLLADGQSVPLTTYEGRPAYIWHGEDSVSVPVVVEEAGEYQIVVSYVPLNANYESVTLNLSVDGQEPLAAYQRIPLFSAFVLEKLEFERNERGDQLYPEQLMLREWMNATLRHGEETYNTDALTVYLTPGAHTLTFDKAEGTINLGDICLQKAETRPTYAEYKASMPDAPLMTDSYVVQAEKFSYKNRNAIALANDSNPVASPYDTHELLLNTIDANTFKNHLDRVAYVIDVPADGYYALGIKGTMPGKTDSPVFIDIEVDGKIPFDEFHGIALSYHKAMYNHKLPDTPVYLSAGKHEIAIVLNGEAYYEVSGVLKTLVDEISNLGIQVQKISGNNQDKSREWVMSDYLPEMENDLNRWKQTLLDVEARLMVLTNNHSSEEINNLRIAMRQLDKLIEKPNEVPSRLNALSQGSSSALQTLSKALLLLNVQSFGLDELMIGLPTDSNDLPITNGNYAFAIAETAKQLMRSFQNDKVELTVDDDTIVVWVKRTRQYVDVLQTLAEETFTTKTGVKVKFSLFTDQTKLTLANAAGRQPDIVLGVDSYYINDLALRGCLTNLLELNGIKDSLADAAPGALLQMIVDNKLYGLPEWQTFSVLYYRTDIFDAYGWKAPDTWEEVTRMLSALQRSGMNFYTPLASSDAFKSWPSTMPFYAQFGAPVFSEDRFGATIDSEQGIAAMTFMTNLFKIYGMPLQVSSFYNDFRSGRIPIGVSGISTYLELTYGAPELEGRWAIAPIPGTKNADGEIERWTTGGSTAACIFDACEKKDMAWEFIQWWLSEETQTSYTEKMQNMYGQEFLWISGNINVLANLPIPSADRKVIAEQIQWIQEAPKIPGGYYTERQVSDAFSRIVYDGADVRSAIDDAVVIANRELERKLREFKYMDDYGNLIKQYNVPTIAQVKGWLDE